MRSEEARAIVGQEAWETFAKTTLPGFLRPDDRERYIECYLSTMEARARVCILLLNDLGGKLNAASYDFLKRMGGS